MSTPKPPKKSAEQSQLEKAQVDALNARLAEEKQLIAERKRKLKTRSIGRQSLIGTSSLGKVGGE